MTATEARLFAHTTHVLLDWIRNETVITDEEMKQLSDECEQLLKKCD